MALIKDIKIKHETQEAESNSKAKSILDNLLLNNDDTSYDSPELLTTSQVYNNIDNGIEISEPVSEESCHGDFQLHDNNDSSLISNMDTETETSKGFARNNDISKNVDFKCRVCSQQFDCENGLIEHEINRRLADKRIKCCGCEKYFRDKTQFNVHCRGHTGEKPFVCTICNKRFTVNGNMKKHMRIHTGERRFECDKCGRKFSQFAHLEDHARTHSAYAPFKCDFCNVHFKTKARLVKHRKSHDEQRMTKRSIPCPLCNRVLRSNKQLIAHMETHDNSTNDPFPCELCQKKFKNLLLLSIHMKSHNQSKDYQCTICYRTFYNASHLRRHLNTHTGVRPYSCETCTRAFASLQNLKRHIMTHTGEKPFSCSECGKSFLSYENMSRHMRTHTGEKPFPCNICGKHFAHSTSAKEHMNSHGGEKSFSCDLCDKGFFIKKTLYRHMRDRHPNYFAEFKRKNVTKPTPNLMMFKSDTLKNEGLVSGVNNVNYSKVDILNCVVDIDNCDGEDRKPDIKDIFVPMSERCNTSEDFKPIIDEKTKYIEDNHNSTDPIVKQEKFVKIEKIDEDYS